MRIEDILENETGAEEKVKALKTKDYCGIPPWEELVNEYDPRLHPVMTAPDYRDIRNDDGTLDRVSRITYDLQRLAVHRMSELCYGIPVRIGFNAAGERQEEVAGYIRRILSKNRMDSVNIERANLLFASCEVLTIWYGVEEENRLYGFRSPLKLRCRHYAPMLGDSIYPLYNEFGDMEAISVEYQSEREGDSTRFLDCYTSDRHIQFVNHGDGWQEGGTERYTVGKIPAIYMYRKTPIWEHTSPIVYEMEWAMSRNGNYLRKNSKPIFSISSDDAITFGNEKDENREFRSIIQIPQGGSAQYITWPQAIENLKYFITELRQSFFTQLQLPDWSYESMKATPMSGESRKQLFIDAQLKVREEAGRLTEFHTREINVIKAFLKRMLPPGYADDIDALDVEVEITPYSVTDDSDTITQICTATGGKAVMSQREGIEMLGWSKDPDMTLRMIQEEAMGEIGEATI